ncbi:MAG: O-acetylhomoserine aminocarboxypropyltransferase/cysteine synthase [Oscillospiraceae bacterium]|nr:O-acetylhomoserine aminocarboxypropyltransferase/cysteine synthase [Oscillospiraceae bacterium]
MDTYKLDTIAVRGGYEPDAAQRATVTPIYQTNAYTFESAGDAADLFSLSKAGNIYSRIGNPTVSALENRIAMMEGAVGALAMSSGHAAIFSTILNIAGAGDEIVSSICIYGGAINLLGVTLQNIGIKTVFVDPDDFDAWENAITPRTKAFFIETIGNPNANVADIEKIAAIAHKHGIPLIADSTFTTPYLCRPIEFGADIVIHSATKFLGGQGNSMAGVVVDSGKFKWAGNERFPQYNTPDKSYHGLDFGKDLGDAGFIIRLRALVLRDIGTCLSPFNAFLTLNGIETLSLRMRRHCDNALKIAQYLDSNPNVTFVNYPGLEGNKYYPLAKKYFGGDAGSVFTFGLRGGREAGVKFIDNTKLFSLVANVGDTRSLVIHPATTTHSQLSDEQLKASGISADTVRLSVGIEDIDDLLHDLENAIQIAVK